MANNTRYGNLKFRAQLDTGHYFITYLKMIGLFIAFISAAILIGGGLAFAVRGLSEYLSQITTVLPEGALSVLATIPLAIMYMMLILFSKSFVGAIIRKHYFSKTYIAGIANLDSLMTVKSLFWVYFKNAILLVVTLGFYYPWAKINLTKYNVENTMINLSDDVGEVISEQQELSSFGDELGDAFDIDVVGAI